MYTIFKTESYPKSSQFYLYGLVMLDGTSEMERFVKIANGF